MSKIDSLDALESAWVRLFSGETFAPDIDHLTLFSRGFLVGIGSGIWPSA